MTGDGTAQAGRAGRGFASTGFARLSAGGGDCEFYLDAGDMDLNGGSAVAVLGPGRGSGIVAHSFVDSERPTKTPHPTAAA